MIAISTNMGDVLLQLRDRVSALSAPAICLQMATAVLPELRKRIHTDGQAADGSQIGTYTKEYMKVRTGSGFQSKTIARGARKGQSRDRFNRTSDSKVVASLTRNMEDNLVVIPKETGAEIGWIVDGQNNYKKSIWVEETYNKSIYSLTDKEREIAFETANSEVERILA